MIAIIINLGIIRVIKQATNTKNPASRKT